MSGCISAFGGIGEVELCLGIKQLKEEHPPLLSQLEGLLEDVRKIEKVIIGMKHSPG